MRIQSRILGLIAIAVLVVIGFIEASPVSMYISEVKEASSFHGLISADEIKQLKQKIHQGAKSRNQSPVDARVDSVWKAIPDLEGRIVDEQATLQKTLAQKDRTKINWVYQTIQPKVTLKQLGAVPIYRGNTAKQSAGLMVNVAWGTEHLKPMLAILKKEQIKATFFFDGSWLSKHPQEAKMILTHGHEIGNHAYTHPLMSRISTARMDEEIGKTEQSMKRILHKKSRFFAPPAGDFDQRVVDRAWAHQMQTVLWTVDTVDWRKSSTPEIMIDRVRTKLGNGSLLLTHPTDRTVKALPEIIRIGKRKGIKWGTVSEVLSSKRLDVIE